MIDKQRKQRIKALRLAPVIPDESCLRDNAWDLADANTDATGAADGYWVAGELIRRMAKALDAADAMFFEAHQGGVRAGTARSYALARDTIRLGEVPS